MDRAIPLNPKYQQQKGVKDLKHNLKIKVQILKQDTRVKTFFLPFLRHAIQDQTLLNLQNRPQQQF